MGTRHLICAVVDKEMKLANYAQWDGDPGGNGLYMLGWLRVLTAEQLDELKNKIKALKPITGMPDFSDMAKALGYTVRDRDGYVEFENRIQEESFFLRYPQLSRDMSWKVLPYILASKPGEYVKLAASFAGDSLMCEWVWLIDFDTMTFEGYEGFNKEPLKEDERFYTTAIKGDEYKQVKLVAKFPLSALPTDDEFLRAFSGGDDDED